MVVTGRYPADVDPETRRPGLPVPRPAGTASADTASAGAAVVHLPGAVVEARDLSPISDQWCPDVTGCRRPDSPRSLQMPVEEPVPVLRPEPTGCRCARPDRRAAAHPWCRRCRTDPGPAAGGSTPSSHRGRNSRGTVTCRASSRRARGTYPPAKDPAAEPAWSGHPGGPCGARPPPGGCRRRAGADDRRAGRADQAAPVGTRHEHRTRAPGAAHRRSTGHEHRAQHRTRGPGRHRAARRARPVAWSGSAPGGVGSGLAVRGFRRRGCPGRPGR